MPKKAKVTPKKKLSSPKTAALKKTVKAVKAKEAPTKEAPKSKTKLKKELNPTLSKKTGAAGATIGSSVQLPLDPSPIAVNIGDVAPEFELPDAYGKMHRLSSYKGKKVVIYFYPKDNTPGCTIEACDFRDKNTAINNAGAVTIGISPDNPPSHQKFIVKYNLGFLLLADAEKEVSKKYGVWKEKHNYGQTYWGIERTTLVVDEHGKVSRIYPKVQVQGHVEQVLADLKASLALKP